MVYQGRRTLADRDYIDIKINATSSPEVSINQLVKRATISVTKVSDHEFNLVVLPYFDKSTANLIKQDNQGRTYLQACQKNYTLNHYTNAMFKPDASLLMVDNNLYWIGVSTCNAKNQLILVYYELGGNATHIVNQDISYIRQYDGSIISTDDFCKLKS